MRKKKTGIKVSRTNATSANLTKPSKPKRHRKRKWLIIGIFMAVILIGVIVTIIIKAPWSPFGHIGRCNNKPATNAPRDIMACYLNDKYGQDFVVELYSDSAEASKVFYWNRYKLSRCCVVTDKVEVGFVVYPRNDPQARFLARYDDGKPSDSYTAYLWREQEIKRLKPIVKRLFGAQAKLAINFDTTNYINGQVMDEIKESKHTMNLQEAISKYGGKINYHLWIKDIKENITEQDKEREVEVLKKLAKSLPTDADIIYVSKIFDEDKDRYYGLITSPPDLSKSTSDKLVDRYHDFRGGKTINIIIATEGDDPTYFTPSSDDWR